MPFVYTANGFFFAESYDPTATDPVLKYGSNVLAVDFDLETNQVQVQSTGAGSIKPIADADEGEGPPLLESELAAKLEQYCVLKSPAAGGPQAVQGSLEVAGQVVAAQVLSVSDARLKRDVRPLGPLPRLAAYSYEIDGRTQYGVLAQEARARGLDALVVERPGGYLSVDYNGLVALLLQRVNDLEDKVDSRRAL